MNVNERRRQWRRDNPGRHSANNRRSYLKRTYGITEEAYDAMLLEQGGLCRLCGAPPVTRRLDVDHCHTTGQVRALLCNKCNQAIGLMQERPELLRDAATYLEEFNALVCARGAAG